MDLKEIEEEEIDDVRRFFRYPTDFRELVRKGELKEFYGWRVYPAYKDLFVDKEPTYYRKGSSLARNYAYRNANPVIVYLIPNAYSEKDFRNYTGMTTDFFLKQVENNEIIPMRGLSKDYEGNSFYENFFEKWGKHLGEKPPVFANAVEFALTEERGEIKDFWESKANELEEDFSSLKGKKIQPAPELSPKDCIRFFAERFGWLELIGMEDFVRDVKSLLHEYNKKGDEELLNNAGIITFHGHQIFSVKAFYSKGSTVTFSIEDYKRATETIRRLWKRREERGRLVNVLTQMSIPLSYYISEVKKVLTFAIPKTETKWEEEQVYHKFKKNEDVFEARNEETIMENQHMADLKNVQKHGGIEIGAFDDSRRELGEIVGVYMDSLMETKMAPHDWAKTVFEIGSTIAPIPMSIKELIPSPDILSAINELIRTGKIKEYFEKTILPSIGAQISVWEEGKTPKWDEIV